MADPSQIDFKLAKKGIMKDFEGSFKLQPYSQRSYDAALLRSTSNLGSSVSKEPPWASLAGGLRLPTFKPGHQAFPAGDSQPVAWRLPMPRRQWTASSQVAAGDSLPSSPPPSRLGHQRPDSKSQALHALIDDSIQPSFIADGAGAVPQCASSLLAQAWMGCAAQCGSAL